MMNRYSKNIVFGVLALCLMAVPMGAAKKQSKSEAAIQKKVEATLAELTLEEKMDLLLPPSTVGNTRNEDG